jgi:hypothetical protein
MGDGEIVCPLSRSWSRSWFNGIVIVFASINFP